jgi:hypothetical protein
MVVSWQVPSPPQLHAWDIYEVEVKRVLVLNSRIENQMMPRT